MLSGQKLSSIREGESCIIADMEQWEMSQRLKELGFTKGTEIQCLYRSFSGDPTAYYVKGTVIALRKEDSARITVSL